MRNLEREIGSICRKLARRVLKEKLPRKGTLEVTPEVVRELLGKPRFRTQRREDNPEIGAAAGLAWTQVGGEILTTEVILMRGKGKLTLTGKLGEVMQESAQAALSFVRSRTETLNIDPEIFEKTDVHIHVPEGAIPKDGPSAGITLCAALVSAFTSTPVRADLAMTGEITLRGQVLPVGGVKEKLLAAYRAGIFEVLIPEENEKDLEEIPPEVRKEMTFHLIKTMDQVLELALLPGARRQHRAGVERLRVRAPPITCGPLTMEIRSVSFQGASLRAADRPKQWFPQVAFAGRSNVGKSSLLNWLFKRQIARVAKAPGKTRTLNFYLVNSSLFFVDLPGYGYAKVARHLRGAVGTRARLLPGRRTTPCRDCLTDRYPPSPDRSRPGASGDAQGARPPDRGRAHQGRQAGAQQASSDATGRTKPTWTSIITSRNQCDCGSWSTGIAHSSRRFG